MAHWDDENFHTVVPQNDIMCKTCANKLPSVRVGDRMVDRSAYGTCTVYDLKPQDVLWQGTWCPKYKRG